MMENLFSEYNPIMFWMGNTYMYTLFVLYRDLLFVEISDMNFETIVAMYVQLTRIAKLDSQTLR